MRGFGFSTFSHAAPKVTATSTTSGTSVTKA